VGGAGRLAAVTVSVIVLIPQHEAVWRVALFRFLEVSWGIAVALVVVWLAAAIRRLAARK
jgi:membrane protease YdiL (CAAX protease family)